MATCAPVGGGGWGRGGGEGMRTLQALAGGRALACTLNTTPARASSSPPPPPLTHTLRTSASRPAERSSWPSDSVKTGTSHDQSWW